MFIIYCKSNNFSKSLILNIYFKKIYSDFELHGIDEERLNSKTYQSITRRLQLEETNSALNDLSNPNSAGRNNTSLPYLSNLGASQAVINVGSMVEGAGAKVFALFK